MIKSFFIVLLTSFFASCKQDENLKSKEDTNPKNSYLFENQNNQTITTNLPNGVESIQIMSKSDQRFYDHFEILPEGLYNSINDTVALYKYSGGNFAFIFVKNNMVIYSLLLKQNGNVEELIKFDLYPEITNKKIVRNIEYLLSPGSDRQTWGQCMDSAIDLLYDNWVDEPFSTSVCWLSGPACAIGAGLACVFL